MKELRQEESFENLKNDCLKIYMNAGVDDAGFGRIRSKGDQALFGGFTTKQMKERLECKIKGRLQILPTLYYCQSKPATEMTNYTLKKKNRVRRLLLLSMLKIIRQLDMLGQRGIKPENLPASEDIKKIRT